MLNDNKQPLGEEELEEVNGGLDILGEMFGTGGFIYKVGDKVTFRILKYA